MDETQSRADKTADEGRSSTLYDLLSEVNTSVISFKIDSFSFRFTINIEKILSAQVVTD